MFFDEATGETVGEHFLSGEPTSLQAALQAPVIACGMEMDQVIVCDIERGGTEVVYRPHYPAPRNNQVTVAVSPDGDRIVSQGTLDHQLYGLGRGSPEVLALGELEPYSRNLDDDHFLASTPDFGRMKSGSMTGISMQMRLRMRTITCTARGKTRLIFAISICGMRCRLARWMREQSIS